MTATCCPSCYQPVDVKANAKEGRCERCRPRRTHSQPRQNYNRTNWAQFLLEHERHRP